MCRSIRGWSRATLNQPWVESLNQDVIYFLKKKEKHILFLSITKTSQIVDEWIDNGSSPHWPESVHPCCVCVCVGGGGGGLSVCRGPTHSCLVCPKDKDGPQPLSILALHVSPNILYVGQTLAKKLADSNYKTTGKQEFAGRMRVVELWNVTFF